MEEALEVRLLLETRAESLACERRPDDAIDEVKLLLDQTYELMDRPKLYIHKNSEYHFKIYSYSYSPLLLEIINRLWARVGPYFIIYALKKEDLINAEK